MGASLFLVDTLPAGERVTLAGTEGHHAATVQRLRGGEELLVGDGRGALVAGVVTGVGRSTLELQVTGRRYEQPQLPRLVVAQAIAKGDRGELAVQAMTEVGVDEVVPWAAARSVAKWRGERGERAWQRWVLTAREAAKQARRSWLPAVSAPASTLEITTRLSTAAATFVLHEEATTRLTEVELPTTGDILLVIGPEGGISPKELVAFEGAGAVPVRLGSGVLRTSTAGVAALSVLSTRLGRW